MAKYDEKLRRMDEHLKEHPNDYQTVISLIKTNSDAIEHKRYKMAQERVIEVARIRAERRARRNEKFKQ